MCVIDFKVPNASLEGYTGPIYHPGFERLESKCKGKHASARLNAMFFDDLADQLRDGVAVSHPVTGDVTDPKDSPWLYASYWTRRQRNYAVLVRQPTPPKRKSPKDSDHRIALYVQGPLPAESELNLVIKEFADDFLRTYKNLYHHDVRTEDGRKP